MDISKRIIEVREEKRKTQADLARLLGMEQSNYARLEKRGKKLTFEQIEKIASALDISSKELLFGESQEIEKGEKIKELEDENYSLKKELNYLKTIVADKEQIIKLLNSIEVSEIERNVSDEKGSFLLSMAKKKLLLMKNPALTIVSEIERKLFKANEDKFYDDYGTKLQIPNHFNYTEFPEIVYKECLENKEIKKMIETGSLTLKQLSDAVYYSILGI